MCVYIYIYIYTDLGHIKELASKHLYHAVSLQTVHACIELIYDIIQSQYMDSTEMLTDGFRFKLKSSANCKHGTDTLITL